MLGCLGQGERKLLQFASRSRERWQRPRSGSGEEELGQVVQVGKQHRAGPAEIVMRGQRGQGWGDSVLKVCLDLDLPA